MKKRRERKEAKGEGYPRTNILATAMLWPLADGDQPLTKLECGPLPNVMVALLNIGGTVCSTSRSSTRAHYLSAVQ